MMVKNCLEMGASAKSSQRCLFGAFAAGAALMTMSQAQAAPQQASRADDFVDSIGVCLHVQNYNDTQWNTVKSQLGTLGVRYYRDGLEHVDNATLKSRLQGLYDSYGMKMLAVTGPMGNSNLQPTSTGSLQHVADKVAGIKPFLLAVEGPNEPEYFWYDPWNYGGFTDRPSQVIWYQNKLYDTIKADSRTSSIPVTSTALARVETYDNWGWSASRPLIKHDILAWHYYNGRYLPTPYDWLPKARAALSSGSKPTYLTEHGYQVSGNQYNSVGQKGQMKLNTRSMAFFFENPDAVNSKVFFYVAGPDHEDFGLDNADFTPRPAYNALKNVVSYLKEGTWNASSKTWSKPSFTPGSLDYTLSGQTGDYGWRLLQKSNGEFYLMALPYIQVTNPSDGSDINNTPRNVTISFPTSRQVVQYKTDDNGNYTGTTLTTGATSVNVALNDTLMIFKISGGGAVSSVPVGQRIGFKSTQNGRFVSTNLNDSSFLIAQLATSVGSWEKFDVVDAGSGQVALRSVQTGRYVTCDLNTAERRLRADWSTGIGSWERFIWEDRGNSNFALKSVASGRYVSADMNTTQKYLKAQWATSVGAWENFQWVSAP